MSFYVYILASRRNGTLYIGSTDSITRRTIQHQDGAFDGFTRKYGVKHLVWYERHNTRDDAFRRERQMKKWNRLWKLELIERFNPQWRDLADELLAHFEPSTATPAIPANEPPSSAHPRERGDPGFF